MDSALGPKISCNQCGKHGTKCEVGENAKGMCLRCQKSKVCCTYGGSDMAPRSVSGMKWKENATMALVSPRGGERQKRAKKVMAKVASAEEVEAVLGGMILVGLSWPVATESVAQILDQRLSHLVTSID